MFTPSDTQQSTTQALEHRVRGFRRRPCAAGAASGAPQRKRRIATAAKVGAPGSRRSRLPRMSRTRWTSPSGSRNTRTRCGRAFRPPPLEDTEPRLRELRMKSRAQDQPGTWRAETNEHGRGICFPP